MPRSDSLVGGLGGEPRLVVIDIDKGVQLLILRANSREQLIDEIDRQEPTFADFCG